MERTKLGFIIGMVALGSLAGIFMPLYFISDVNHDSLSSDYMDLFNDLQNLESNYSQLLSNYQILTGDYNTLFDNYEDLESQYNSVCSTIKQQILPAQYSFFAEAVRRYYMPIYLEGKIGKTYWKSFTEFCRDIILHDIEQENSFSTVSNAFSDALRFDDDTMYLAWYVMDWTFQHQFSYWGIDLTFNELTNIDIIVDQCINEIDYEYDSDIIDGQEYFDWDYIKFPVETAFRTFGDCEDQAILCSAYLESCDFETAIAIIHDPSHPTEGEFYHAACLVHIEDTSTFSSTYPSCDLWNLGSNDPYYPDYTWCWLDSTWDVPFGSEPSWVQDYGGSLSWDICSIAFCDIYGTIQ